MVWTSGWSGIRGVRSSASLKPFRPFPGVLRIAGIRGVRALASLKLVVFVCGFPATQVSEAFASRIHFQSSISLDKGQERPAAAGLIIHPVSVHISYLQP